MFFVGGEEEFDFFLHFLYRGQDTFALSFESFMELLETCPLLKQHCWAFLRWKVNFCISYVAQNLIRFGHAKSSVYSPTTLQSYMWFCNLFKVSVNQAVDRAKQYAHFCGTGHCTQPLTALSAGSLRVLMVVAGILLCSQACDASLVLIYCTVTQYQHKEVVVDSHWLSLT